ncbi:hypothetical protein BD310DRAFT_890577 [Dichomitus squalens]|uniref:Uncharacterized protein n=1 Tax=Dichomitus squalens TaxID=114155 RepID=A0A4Q9PAX2_9APHY|nr:hypothetical protein BD310DRAFT_890577 [Dichomitus squalens]
MRVIHTRTGQFVDVPDFRKVRYAILSHTWDPGGEQTYQDIRRIQASYGPDGQPRDRANPTAPTAHLSVPTPGPVNSEPSILEEPIQEVPLAESDPPSHAGSPDIPAIWRDPRLSEKVRRACEAARADGYYLLWIDSCCIDKTSSAELSESINSMYIWYGAAHVCHVFLADVPRGDDTDAKASLFRTSRWFTRGWTLQELLAPEDVRFLAQDWSFIGSKAGLAVVLEERTGIELEVLLHKRSLHDVSVAKRMSWAADRETTRVEDRAYSLLGIFDINMPALYGEGERAFRRLQVEILLRIPDQSLFAWTAQPRIDYVGPRMPLKKWSSYDFDPSVTLFATSPSDFAASRYISPRQDQSFVGLYPRFEYVQTPYGIRAQFAMAHLKSRAAEPELGGWYFLILACRDTHRADGLLVRLCHLGPRMHKGGGRLLHLGQFARNRTEAVSADLPLPRGSLFALPSGIRASMKTVYIPGDYTSRLPALPEPTGASPYNRLYPSYFWSTQRHLAIISLSPRSRAILHSQGYNVGFDGRHITQWKLQLSRSDIAMVLDFRPTRGETPYLYVTATAPSSGRTRSAALLGVLDWRFAPQQPSIVAFQTLILTTVAGAQLDLRVILETTTPLPAYHQKVYVSLRPSQDTAAPAESLSTLVAYRPLPAGLEPLPTTETEELPTLPVIRPLPPRAKRTRVHQLRDFVYGIFEEFRAFHVMV